MCLKYVFILMSISGTDLIGGCQQMRVGGSQSQLAFFHAQAQENVN